MKKKKEGEQHENKQSENKQSDTTTATGSDVKASTLNRKVDAIDDLLGGLSSDLEKIGVRTVTKGHCASCAKSIVGKVIHLNKYK